MESGVKKTLLVLTAKISLSSKVLLKCVTPYSGSFHTQIISAEAY
jgi:hypothetical protein